MSKYKRPSICNIPCEVCLYESDFELWVELTRNVYICPNCSIQYVCEFPLGKSQPNPWETEFLCPVCQRKLEVSPFTHPEIVYMTKIKEAELKEKKRRETQEAQKQQ